MCCNARKTHRSRILTLTPVVLAGPGPRAPATADVFVVPKASPVTAETQETNALGIPLTAYSSIRDNTVFQSREHAIWFRTLGAWKESTISAPVSASATESIPRVGFTQLFLQPDAYRGRLVSIAGTVRRAHRLRAPTNSLGITHYWRCWLFPEATTNPIVVYATEMPEGFPEGMDVREAVSFEGIFFKRWAYAAAGGEMLAPLVIAGPGAWHPAPAREPDWQPSITALRVGVLGLAFLAIVLAYAGYRWSTYRMLPAGPSGAVDVQWLKHSPVPQGNPEIGHLAAPPPHPHARGRGSPMTRPCPWNSPRLLLMGIVAAATSLSGQVAAPQPGSTHTGGSGDPQQSGLP